MAHITEHHSEEEWESDHGDWHWVSLLIGWNTIGVYDQLENGGDVCNLEISRSLNCVVVIGNNLGSTVL